MQHHYRDCGNLRHGVGLAKPTGTENLQGPGDVEQRTDNHNNDVAAEDQHGDGPADLVHGGEHQEHGAEQQLVRNRIKILAKQGLLFQEAGQQSIQPVSDSSHNEEGQRPEIVIIQHRNHDKRNKDKAGQGEQVGSGTQLPDHPASSPNKLLTGLPDFAVNCSASDGMSPLRASSSTRSMRCIGKNTALAPAGSPDLTSCANSSKERRSIPWRLTPACSSESTTPQNFSRGLLRVTSTVEPG